MLNTGHSVWMLSNVNGSFTTIVQKYVEDYEGRCGEIMRQHFEAMQCRDCEELLEQGLNAYQRVRQADETIRLPARENLSTTEEDLALLARAPQSLRFVFDLWLRPAERLEWRVLDPERTGYTMAHAADFAQRVNLSVGGCRNPRCTTRWKTLFKEASLTTRSGPRRCACGLPNDAVEEAGAALRIVPFTRVPDTG